jgi:hypothetical protein
MKISLTLCFLILVSALSAQDKIEGVGKFRIDKTGIAVIAELEQELHLQVKKITTFAEYVAFAGLRDGNVMYEMTPDTTTTKDRPDWATYPANCKVYFLLKYKIDKIEYKHITLVFCNDTLVDFTSNGSAKIIHMMKAKYGKPVEYTHHENASNSNTQAPVDIKITDWNWTNNSLIARAEMVESPTLNGPSYVYYEISNDRKIKQIASEQVAISNRIKEREKATKGK